MIKIQYKSLQGTRALSHSREQLELQESSAWTFERRPLLTYDYVHLFPCTFAHEPNRKSQILGLWSDLTSCENIMHRHLYKHVISIKVELRSGAPCPSHITIKGNSHVCWKLSLALALSYFQKVLSVSSLRMSKYTKMR